MVQVCRFEEIGEEDRMDAGVLSYRSCKKTLFLMLSPSCASIVSSIWYEGIILTGYKVGASYTGQMCCSNRVIHIWVKCVSLLWCELNGFMSCDFVMKIGIAGVSFSFGALSWVRVLFFLGVLAVCLYISW
ncbi:hypothetical protein Hanom_Chr16g01427051 [Helianthus anomalus]